MGRSVAVLDWTDIQILVKLSAQSFSSDIEHYAELEAVRHEFIEALLAYLQEWFPGEEVNDSTRKTLIGAIDSFSANYRMQDTDALSAAEVQAQCTRIRELLRMAIERNAKLRGPGGAPLSLVTLLTWCIAAQQTLG